MNKSFRFGSVSVAVVVAASTFVAVPMAYSVGSPTPTVSAKPGTGMWKFQASGPTDTGTSNSPSKSRTFDCGAAGSAAITAPGDPCGTARAACTKADGAATATVQIKAPDGTWTTTEINCAAAPPGHADPSIAAAAHDAFTKRVPTATINSAPPQHRSITGLETLYWLNTPTTVDLGTTPLLGQQVQLLATVQSAHWDFGDTTTATSHGPGRPFLDKDYCNTLTCPAWFGHTYTHTAKQLTVTATATWAGSYSVNGGPFLPINGTVTAATVTTPMQVVESRAVLITNAPGSN